MLGVKRKLPKVFKNVTTDELNRLALAAPKSGDYWQEMLCPVLLVVKVTVDNVYFVSPITKDDGWTFDTDTVQVKSLNEFRNYLSYDTIPDKTWCDVSRNWKHTELFMKACKL